jgi:hypothetical protein
MSNFPLGILTPPPRRDNEHTPTWQVAAVLVLILVAAVGAYYLIGGPHRVTGGITALCGMWLAVMVAEVGE